MVMNLKILKICLVILFMSITFSVPTVSYSSEYPEYPFFTEVEKELHKKYRPQVRQCYDEAVSLKKKSIEIEPTFKKKRHSAEKVNLGIEYLKLANTCRDATRVCVKSGSVQCTKVKYNNYELAKFLVGLYTKFGGLYSRHHNQSTGLITNKVYRSALRTITDIGDIVEVLSESVIEDITKNNDQEHNETLTSFVKAPSKYWFETEELERLPDSTAKMLRYKTVNKSIVLAAYFYIGIYDQTMIKESIEANNETKAQQDIENALFNMKMGIHEVKSIDAWEEKPKLSQFFENSIKNYEEKLSEYPNTIIQTVHENVNKKFTDTIKNIAKAKKELEMKKENKRRKEDPTVVEQGLDIFYILFSLILYIALAFGAWKIYPSTISPFARALNSPLGDLGNRIAFTFSAPLLPMVIIGKVLG
jgi:hypothetical protein